MRALEHLHHAIQAHHWFVFYWVGRATAAACACVRARGVGGLGQLLGDEQHPEGEAVGAAVEAAGDARMKAGKLLAAGAMANDFE